MVFRKRAGIILSVSIFAAGSGAAIPVSVVNFSMVLEILPHIDEPAGDRRRRGHGRRDEMRASSRSLPAFEIAIGGAGAALAGRELIGVHAKTHRAARLPPFKSRFPEDPVKPLFFGLFFDQAGAGYHQRPHAFGHAPATGDLG